MEPNEPLFAVLAFLGAVVVTLVDGRRAIGYASLAAAFALSPAVASVYGGDAALVVIAAGVLASLISPLTRSVATRISWMPGVDPVVPVVAGGEALFGPRSVRAAATVVMLPAASWVSSNVPIGSAGSASPVTGVLFPAALVFGCALMRLLTARTLNDLAVGVAALGVSGSAAWFLCAGVDTLASAAAAASLAPGAAVAAGWLSGRHAVSANPARRVG